MRLASAANGSWRTLVIAHRYLGVALGLLMVIWFVSGIVMMYVGFPRVSEEERLRTLTPIFWPACCRFADRLAGDDEQVLRAQVENLVGVPTLRLRRSGKPDMSVDLAFGSAINMDADRARAIALDAGPRIIGLAAALVDAEQASTDQWTVGRLFRDRPLYRFAFDDPDRTNIYVSGTVGQVVHWTTATQRFWNWLGAIPHWLYLAELRSNVALWSQVVIYASILGTFLTTIGLILGITQIKTRAGGKLSPYRGWFYWHHVAGLVFGLTTLTWVVSGLVSMNPWGFLEGRRGGEQALVEGRAPKWSEVRASLETISAQPEVAESVSVVAAPLAGELFWLATRNDGTVKRLDASGTIAPMSEADLTEVARRIAGDTEIAEQAMIGEEDTYYFQRADEFVLPVYRVILNDAESRRYYIDPNTGTLLQRVDSNSRWHRWLFGGLHRIDFTAWMRARPAWDIIVLALMLGGLGLTVSGFYLAVRRVQNDLVLLFRFARTRRAILPREDGFAPVSPPSGRAALSSDANLH